jgi:DNA invertase Pin-like site-specific DNA recombinase
MAEANDILTGLSDRGVLFGVGATVHDWSDPFGRLFLQTLAMVAEFEANIGHQRTREGMALAKRNGKLKGKQPKLPEPARRSIRRRYAEGEVSLADLATEYSVGRSTIHRIIHGPAT